MREWFATGLQLTEKLALSNQASSAGIKSTLALSFRDLRKYSGLEEQVAAVCPAFPTGGFWPDGWLAVRRVLHLDRKGTAAESLLRLTDLESALRPGSLVQRVRGLVLAGRFDDNDAAELDDESTPDFTTRMARLKTLIGELSQQVALDLPALSELLPDLMTGEGRLWALVGGPLDGTNDPERLWKTLVHRCSQPRPPQLSMVCFFQPPQSEDALLTNVPLLEPPSDFTGLAASVAQHK